MIGDIIFARFPFADLPRFKERPLLVVSNADHNGDLHVLKITSKEVHADGNIPLSQDDFEFGELSKPSAIVPSSTACIHKSVVTRFAGRLKSTKLQAILKQRICSSTRDFSTIAHANNRPGNDPLHPHNASPSSYAEDKSHLPPDLSASGATFPPSHFSTLSVPYAGRVFNEDEVTAAVSATLDFWLTLGPEGQAMEEELAEFMGVKHSLLVNSGSSANLVAISALTTHKLPKHKRIMPGDEVITVAAGFPTTVAPIIQVGAVPVFIDADPVTGNADCSQLEAAYQAGKTKAVMMAHALGNPFDLATTLAFCKKYDLWLIEDNCDALGCTYSLPVDLAKELGLDHLLKLAEKNSGQETVDGGRETVGPSFAPSATAGAQSEHPTSSPPSDLSAHGATFPLSTFAEASSCAEASEDRSADKSNFPTLARPALLSNLPTKLPAIHNGVLTAYTGSFGDISTQSFYPPHHLTMGEGGAVNIVRRPPLKTYAESFRDWGRDCWCPSGKDNTCNKRFGWQLGELPEGYDHKYIYSHLGYNLKPLDPQAAIGRVQLKKLPAFIQARKENWEYLRRGLHGLEEYFEFSLPTHAVRWVSPAEQAESRGQSAEGSDLQSVFEWQDGSIAAFDDTSSATFIPPAPHSPKGEGESDLPTFIPSHLSAPGATFPPPALRTSASWFGFKLSIKPGAPFTRTDFAKFLDEFKIGNRMLFGGNLVRQPAFVQLKRDRPDAFRVIAADETLAHQRHLSASSATFLPSPLPGADSIMNHTIFLGTYPGLTRKQLDYMVERIRSFIGEKVAQGAKVEK